jgi:hemerythrin
MAFLAWKEAYSAEIPSIDAQHRKLVGMLNELHDAMSHGAATDDKLKRIIDGLVDYTKSHFVYEEQLLLRNGYPLFDEHKRKHVAMTGRVEEFSNAVSGGKKPAIDLATFLRNWLPQQIQGTDKLYTPHLKSKKVA